MCSDPTRPSVHAYGELLGGGVRRSHITQSLKAGRIRRIRVGVYAGSDACAPAVAAAAHGGGIACVTAARHLGLWVLDDDPTVHVWLGRGGRVHHDDGCGCTVHWDDAARNGFGLPPLAVVLWQIRRCRGIEDFFVALESALRQGRLDPAALAHLHALLDSEARRVAAIARSDADSGLESLLRMRLHPHGLRVRTQVDVAGVGRVDFLIGDRLLVEVDRRENHEAAPKRHKDLVRDANAAMWGYRTLRFDYALVVHDWDLVERAILGALQSAA